ncbi:hypothetical protein BSL78_17529 [Apostichopus japonicus]|uniref:Protein kinase domain-containing protein n=1 Tax=Stichopus japonicus TaxID=307972 RepID=A0A2G8KC59_STIJA|nr:hypothetical protein BSL78_17529 [Apostichopus japonicus]
MADVTILEWSRFSNVYRHGLPITLGEGDEGYVQLMRDNQTNQLVAVKTWHKEPHTDVSMMNDVFNYELAAMKKFNGVKYFPKLIGIVPNADSAVSFSLVQEFIGDIRSKRTLSLLDAINDNELMYQEIVSAALDVSEALAEMHRNGWVHCDVKTDNVILKTDSVLQETDVGSDNGWWINEPPTNSSASFHAKLIDFGGARPISEAKLPKKLPKKMKKYMYEMCPQIAPEVVEGLGKVPYSFESDVYSFGRLLKDISELSGLVELDQLANRCLAKSPKKRPNIDSVVDELKKLQ